jgi:hypothetical protein
LQNALKPLYLQGFPSILSLVFTYSLIPMKQGLLKGSLILLLTILYAVACKKSSNPSLDSDGNIKQVVLNTPDSIVPYPAIPLAGCDDAPFYGDSIVYPQPGTSGDYFVNPQNNQGVTGTYLSWPVGLVMDSKSGSIDLTQSETGARYSVAFVKSGTTDTCLSNLIVAGAAYMDSVYVLSESKKTAVPYFNANPFAPAPCQGGQGPECNFDYNDYAKHQGIEIDQKTGFIDLEKTMQKSPFGILPINGTTVYTTIYYKLNDNSNFAPQQIQLKMVYYNRKSDIPPGTIATITQNLLNTLNLQLLSKGPRTRPPLIVIVRQN